MGEKPRIPDDMLAKWQRIVNILAHLLEVPAGLIMKTEPPRHNVFVASANPDNAYDTNTTFTLNSGLYCDKVMQERCLLVVHDAMELPEWDHNPDLKHNMVFYMGFPLIWPDSSIFGTICVLDTKTNTPAISYTDLLAEFKEVVNSDLKFLIETAERKTAQRELQRSRDKLEQRVQQRTEELAGAIQGLKKEIVVRRETEKSLLRRGVKLEEANTALKVVLERVENFKGEFEEQILANINELIVPYVEKLKRRTSDEKARAYIGILEANVNEITAPFGGRLLSKFSKLTPTELEVAKLIMQGKTTKMIANIVNTATSTVDFHRNNIRKKIGINRAQVNLRSYLTSLH